MSAPQLVYVSAVPYTLSLIDREWLRPRMYHLLFTKLSPSHGGFATLYLLCAFRRNSLLHPRGSAPSPYGLEEDGHQGCGQHAGPGAQVARLVD